MTSGDPLSFTIDPPLPKSIRTNPQDCPACSWSYCRSKKPCPSLVAYADLPCFMYSARSRGTRLYASAIWGGGG